MVEFHTVENDPLAMAAENRVVPRGGDRDRAEADVADDGFGPLVMRKLAKVMSPR